MRRIREILSGKGTIFPKNLLIWLVIAVAIRLSLMPFFGDLDLFHMNWVAHLPLAGYSNFYKFAQEYTRPIFDIRYSAYPPLYYFSESLWLRLGQILSMIDLRGWIDTFPLTYGEVIYEWGLGRGRAGSKIFPPYGNIHMFLFWVKIPYLIADMMAGIILYRMMGEKNASWSFKFWALNPAILYISYIWGQMEMLPVFFVVLGLWFASRSFPLNAPSSDPIYPILSLTSLSIGGAFKNYPLLLVPFFALVLGRDFKTRSLLTVTGFTPYLLTLLPYSWEEQSLLKYLLFSGTGMRLFGWWGEVTVKFWDAELSLFLILYAILLVHLYMRRNPHSFEVLWRYSFAALSFIFVFVYWHPYWYLWLLPFMTLSLVSSKYLKLLIAHTVLFFCYNSMFRIGWDPGSFFGIWTHLSPTTTKFLGNPPFNDFALIQTVMQLETFWGATLSLLVGLTIYLAVYGIRSLKQDKALS